jgi:hypothetical protein
MDRKVTGKSKITESVRVRSVADRGYDLSCSPVHCAGSELVVLVFEQDVERGEPATGDKLIFD